MSDFPSGILGDVVASRTYFRRREDGSLENWEDVCDRTIPAIAKLGDFTLDEEALVYDMQIQLKTLTSGRWLWVGGTEWSLKPENFAGTYNCSSTDIIDWESFANVMNLAMQGCGTGAVLEERCISQLPIIRNRLSVTVSGEIGAIAKERRTSETYILTNLDLTTVDILVGDSRQGWVDAYKAILELSSDEKAKTGEVAVSIDISNIRPSGEPLKSFGGTANPAKLPSMFPRIAKILNGAIGRKLTSVECCLLIDEAAVVIVAGSIRRCLPENALIHTPKGLVPIKDIQVGDLVQTPKGYREVINKFNQGLQNVYDIETNATHPRATLNHKIAVFADVKGGIEWKAVRDLEVGDRLAHINKPTAGRKTSLPPDFTADRPRNSRNAKDFSVPELDTDIAWLIGYTHGNGYVCVGRNKHNKPYGSVSWSMNNTQTELRDMIRDRIELAVSKFGLSVSHNVISGENTAKTICNSIRMGEYFLEYIKKPKEPLSLPSFVLQAPENIRAAYLAGLMDSDGSVKNRPPHLVTTIYKSFIEQVGSLLSSLNIAGRRIISIPKEESWSAKHSITIPAFKDRYNAAIAPYSLKGEIHQGLKMYGFTFSGQMMRQSYSYTQMQGMGFAGSKTVDSNVERYFSEENVDIDIPATFKGLGFPVFVQTYDIEVEDEHCFYADGFLTHNSAGMRQFSDSDQLGEAAKDNLWIQLPSGDWSIDPDRDALRMANHSRVFHHKPSWEEILSSVTKQYRSGEGAIQYAPEAIARANADLLDTDAKRREFIRLYEHEPNKQTKGNTFAGLYLDKLNQEKYGGSFWESDKGKAELLDRLHRLGLNPCFAGDMKLLTVDGYKTFESLDGKTVPIVNAYGEISTSEVWCSGTKEVISLSFLDGKKFVCTPDHKLLTAEGSFEAKDCNKKRLMPFLKQPEHDPYYIALGFIQGDGSLGRINQNGFKGIEVNIGSKDQDILRSLDCLSGMSVSYKWHGDRKIYVSGIKDLLIKEGFCADICPERTLPSCFQDWAKDSQAAFLNGLYGANGSILSCGRITFKTTSSELATQIKSALKTFEIESYITTNKPALVNFPNGIYQTRESYDVNIQRYEARQVFFNEIGFPLEYKTQKLSKILLDKAPLVVGISKGEVIKVYDFSEPLSNWGVVNGIVAHNCGEINMKDNFCNLAEVHLNQIEPTDFAEQEKAFKAGALSVAALLNHDLSALGDRYQQSREWDPIVAVCPTGIFDFFVKAFGVNWLKWWEAGRPDEWGKTFDEPQSIREDCECYQFKSDYFRDNERSYLKRWRETVEETVKEYCDRHGLKASNRSTAIQPSGSKSLLTGASPGYHPPKAAYMIRRITVRKNHPVAMTAIALGYAVVPSQSDKDENGLLLNDPLDSRVTEWLIEIPMKTVWADLDGADAINTSKFSAIAQFDFMMQVQKHYVRHNTSSTLELRESEIEPLAKCIYDAIQKDEGYISSAILARFDDVQTYPRLPFEPTNRADYENLEAAIADRKTLKQTALEPQLKKAGIDTYDFDSLYRFYDQGETLSPETAACDTGLCELKETLEQIKADSLTVEVL